MDAVVRLGFWTWRRRHVTGGRRLGFKDMAAKIFLEAMGIEPATRDMESRLTTISAVVAVMTWCVICTLTGESGRFWKSRSCVSRRAIQNARVCGFGDG